MTKFAGYTEAEIQPVFDLMTDHLQGPVVHEALFKKYASKKFWKGREVPFILIHLAYKISASIQARKWAKELYSSLNIDGGVAIGDIKVDQ